MYIFSKKSFHLSLILRHSVESGHKQVSIDRSKIVGGVWGRECEKQMGEATVIGP